MFENDLIASELDFGSWVDVTCSHQSLPHTEETVSLLPPVEELELLPQAEVEEEMLWLPHDEEPLFGVCPHEELEYELECEFLLPLSCKVVDVDE